jgi:hypothetical protein
MSIMDVYYLFIKPRVFESGLGKRCSMQPGGKYMFWNSYLLRLLKHHLFPKDKDSNSPYLEIPNGDRRCNRV